MAMPHVKNTKIKSYLEALYGNAYIGDRWMMPPDKIFLRFCYL